MRCKRLWLLAGLGLAGCGQQIELSPDVALTHRHEAAFRQQVRRLGAERVKLSGRLAADGGVLDLEVRNPEEPPGQPDTLRLRVQKLARLVAVDVADPADYPAISVQVVTSKGYFDKNTGTRFFIFQLAALRQTPQP